MIRALGLLAVVLLPTLAAAQTAETLRAELAKCADEQSELRRLVCYDAIAESLGVDGAQPGPATATSVEQYRNNVVIEDLKLFEGRTLFGLGEPVTGLSGRVRNTGDRTLQTVRIIVYFLDDQGDAIGEQEFIPVLYREGRISLEPNVPLRPNYVEDFSYSLEDAPSTWRGLGYRVELGSIEFLDEG